MATVTGTTGNDRLVGTASNDTISGLGGNDTIVGGSGGTDVIDGGAGFDTIEFGAPATSAVVVDFRNGTITGGGTGSISFTSIERVVGSNFNDLLIGNAAGQNLTGQAGADTLWGAGGVDTLWGGGGAGDTFIFRETGIANADFISDFTSGVDKIQLDAAVMTALGASGNFAAGDGRFWAAAGATGGHDADDRIIYDTTTRKLYYDADGSGSGAAVLIATLQSGATLAATDIVVEDGSSGGGGQVINGTAGNDSLDGGPGNDSISGFDGDDTLNGNAGNDTLDGGEGRDTLAGGLGDDTYVVNTYWSDVIADLGGIDTVMSHDGYQLGDGLENLTLVGTSPDNRFGSGNSLNNVIVGSSFGDSLDGREGNDTIRAGDGDDWISFSAPGGNYGNDSVDGGAGFDTLSLGIFGSGSAVVLNVASGTASGGGTGGSGSVVFFGIEHFFGTDFADRMDAGALSWGVALQAEGGNDTVTGGAAADWLHGGDGNDQIAGLGGDDTLISGLGSDNLRGGDGADWLAFDNYYGSAAADTLDGGTGVDTLAMEYGPRFVDLGAGIAGDTAGDSSWGTLIGIENVVGRWNAETIVGSAGANVLDGGGYHDSLDGAGGNDTVFGGDGSDTLRSGAGNDSVDGGRDDDWIIVDAGNDTVTGGAGLDRLLFDQAPSSANADLITDFASGTDELVFDAAAHAGIGPVGNLASSDERFHAAAGANGAHDATDRLIYNTTTGDLYYDADGLGGTAAVRIATLQGAPSFAATDIRVMSEGVSGLHITGTGGDDRLEGGTGNDTLEGLGGNDTLIGHENYDILDGGDGADSMVGGGGNDTLYGGTDYYYELSLVDTMDGGLGNDTYVVSREVGYWHGSSTAAGVVIQDAGGIDTVVARSGNWILGPGLENLDLDDYWDEGYNVGVGNELDNVIWTRSGYHNDAEVDGADGNDTLIGDGGTDTFRFVAGSGDIGHDVVDGGFGEDALDFDGARSGVTIDFRSATASGGGTAGSGSVSFSNIEEATGSEFDDVLIAGDGFTHGDDHGTWFAGYALFAGSGNDTLTGGADNDQLYGDGRWSPWSSSNGFGDDELRGGGGNDILDGGRGADWLDGGQGNDSLNGGEGGDTFAFTASPGTANSDAITGFVSGSDVIRLDTNVYGNLGAQGRFSAGDERFYAAAGATSGHDATDRIVFDTSNGNLWYDADGSGSGAASLIVNSNGAIAAGDIIVGVVDAPGTGQNQAGTAGNDTLIGGAGNDTLEGGAGNDSLVGVAGRDSLVGGSGDDTLDGGAGNDTMNGGLGNDTYIVGGLSDVLSDSGGIDTVVLEPTATDWILATGFENLTLRASPESRQVLGNEANNVIDGSAATLVYSEGRAGHDSLSGGASADTLLGGDGDDSLFGAAGDDTLDGQVGNDWVRGGDGNDALDGGSDTWWMPAYVDDGGNDTLEGGDGNDGLAGGKGNDVLRGDAGDDQITGGSGADSMYGGDGNDYFFTWDVNNLDAEADLIDGGAGLDFVGFYGAFGEFRDLVIDLEAGTVTKLDGSAVPVTLASIEGASGSQYGTSRLIGNAADNNLAAYNGNDSLYGGAGNDTMSGNAGNDIFDGGAGNDTLSGGSGQDTFMYSVAPGVTNADLITDFTGGTDRIALDNAVHRNLGAAGDFAAGDERFWAASGATAGHDASDRVIYNTTTGELFYDPDGNGALGARLVATLQYRPALAATDITVGGDGTPSGTFGTPGNDSLVGTDGDDIIDALAGNDTIDGRAGDDELYGSEGNDSIAGGTGNDYLDGGDGVDTIDGGSGDDVYVVTHGDVLLDSGGGDTVASSVDWILASGFENLTLMVGAGTGRGNDLGNRIIGNDGFNNLYGGAGNDFINGGEGWDYLTGEAGDDTVMGADGSDVISLFFDDTNYGRDVIDGGAGWDTLQAGSNATSALIVDLTAGTASGGGTGNATVAGIEAANGTQFNDRIVGDWQANTFIGYHGNDTLDGASGDDQLQGEMGNDSLVGGDGQDWLQGGDGDDTLLGGTGNDNFFQSDFSGASPGRDIIDAGAGSDWLRYDFFDQTARSGVVVNMANGTASGGGEAGAGSATFANIEHVVGSVFGDSLIGNGEGNSLYGLAGDDTLNGGAGVDYLEGGAGIDQYLFSDAPGGVNADTVFGFTSGQDRIHLDALDMTALGLSGNFSSNDVRFYSAAGATAGHDADDRIIYNTSTGSLYYDGDGSGAGAAQLIATLVTSTGGPSFPSIIAASDFTVDNGSTSSGQVISGTSGNDSLQGGSGNDTLDGLGGVDTMNGGLGDDLYIVTAGDVLSDPGGIDTVQTAVNWSLGTEFENLTMTGTAGVQMQGNNLNNLVIGNSAGNYFNARAGTDTIQAGGGNDTIDMSSGGIGNHGNDVIDGGAAFDTIDYDGYATTGIIANFATGTISGGDAAGSSVSFTNVEAVVGGAFADQMTGNASGQNLTGKGGNDTLWGAGGADTLWGGTGADSFVFREMGSADRIGDFVSNSDKISLDDAAFTAIGATGNFAAGDGRFWSAPGAITGHDANDRVVYNTTTGSLYYDADGSGAGAAQLIATFTGNPTIAATDLVVI